MFNKKLKVTGKVDVVVYAADGSIKDERHVSNLVVDSGLDFIASRMSGTSSSVMSHMAVGTSSTSPAAGNTTLGSESARVALTSTTPTDNSVAYVATFGAGVGTAALTEAGIFNASSAGDMLCRVTYSVINKGAADTMTITWTITIS